ncbi:MAG: SRPBCC family protein [Pseudoruegeria sp.]
MAYATTTRIINAPLSKVWNAWDDFGDIYKFNPNLKGSHLLPGSVSTGLGAERQCDLTDGNSLKERLTRYQPERLLEVEVFEHNLPVKKMVALVEFKAISVRKTEVCMTLTFTPRMGVLGRIMGPIMSKMMKRPISELLKGNAEFVESGKMLNVAA